MKDNSSKATQSGKPSLGLKRYILLLTAAWTLTVGVSLTWNYFHERDAARQAASVAARAQFTKDVIYRRWNAGYGGVYVPISESIQPNPYLTQVEEREIETPSGRRLTLINPAYMTRLVHELGFEAEGVRGHITSLDPIRPANAPDAWEKRALERFEKGAQEFASIETLDGEAHLRLMRPLMTEKGCLKCHAQQGYKEGDVRGGISVAMPMAPYAETVRKNMTTMGVGHGALWLLGLAALAFGTRHIQQRVRERDRAEEALRELNATLETQVAARTAEIRAEKERSETILRSVGDAIMMTDREMRIQYVNPAFTTLTGYTAEEVLGQHASSIGAAVGSEQVQQSIESALAEGRQWQGEASSQRKDGRIYDAALIISPLRDAAGNLTGYVASHRDISQQKALDRARRQFMTNVSHELRTPVSNIKLYTHLLQRGQRPEKAEIHLQVLVGQTERLEELIQDILEITLLDSGQALAEWKSVSLSTVVADAVTRYQSRAEASGLILVAEPTPPDLPVVRGDQARLVQALGELVEKAIIFTPTGGQVAVETEVVEEEGDRWVTIAVRDTGPGISPQEQERVFDRFYRGSLAESGHIPGTGLGLSIAQEILQAHGGRVTMESEVGEGAESWAPAQGSTFTLWLRSVPDEESE